MWDMPDSTKYYAAPESLLAGFSHGLQDVCATPDDRTQHRAGAGIVPEMRLCDVAYID
jgi:hypothetical protein